MKKTFAFPSTEKLKRRKQIESLFADGRWLRSEHMRLVYLLVEKESEVPCQALFTAAKKVHRRAVKRNLLKRRMREAYRLNKALLFEELGNIDGILLVGFVYSSPTITDYKQISIEIKKLIAQTARRVSKENKH